VDLKSKADSPRAASIHSFTLQSVAAGVLMQAFLVVTGVIAARSLGVEGRGDFALVTLVPVILCQFFGLGVPQSVTYHVASRRSIAAPLMEKMGAFIVLQMIFILALHYGVVQLLGFSGEAASVTSLALCIAPSFLLYQYALAVLQGLKRFSAFNFLRVLPAGLCALAMALTLLVDRNKFFWITAAFVGSWTLTGVTAVAVSVSRARAAADHSSAGKVPETGEVLLFGVKGLFGTIPLVESLKLDQLFAGLLLSSKALGFYVVAVAFTNLPRFVSQSVGMTAYPHISSKRTGSDVLGTIRRFLFYGTLLCGGVVAVLVLAVPVLLPLFFGNEFAPSVPIARIILAGAFLYSVRLILVECMRGLAHPEISTWAQVSTYPWIGVAILVSLGNLNIFGLSAILASSQVVGLAMAAWLSLRAVRRLSR
jgi:O-antigen/teichoic acid export membrane protein